MGCADANLGVGSDRRTPQGVSMSTVGSRAFAVACALALAAFPAPAQRPAPEARQPNWPQIEQETMQHFQALLRFDTSDPPGNEKPAADYLKQVLEREGIPVEIIALEPNRPNVIATLKGNGSKRPLLIMA